MISPITFFEHEMKPFEWTDHDLSALEGLNRSLDTEVLHATVRGRQRMLKARQMVGVVRLGNRTIQILPKIYRSRGEEQKQIQEATRNLLYLLAYAGRLSVREHDVAPLLRRNLDWFELLTHLFASNLLEEWQRGAYRGYQIIEEESHVLKGKLRVVDQIRRPGRKHRFDVRYDEFTADNQLNRVFRFVVERLWYLSHNAGNRRLLGELRHWMDDVTLLPSVVASEASPALLSRLNQRYKPLLNLARLFLSGSALQMAADRLTTFAFVFDMNALFERFLVNFIRHHRRNILPPELQDCDLLPQSRRAPLYLAQTEHRLVFQLRPDLVFRSGDTFPLLLDAKYKRLTEANTKLGVTQSDFYQMHAYAGRYDCPRVLLIYPQTSEMSESLYRRFVLEHSKQIIVAATVDMRRELRLGSERQHLIDELKHVIGGEDDSS